MTGQAQSVYTGLIRVAETAPGTDAYQTNRNLKLSDDAWAYSVPNLEIEQNQVSCSHASTVGEIDEQQRFYLESRGVPSTEAEQLLVSGFFAEVIDALPVPELRPALTWKSRIAQLKPVPEGAFIGYGCTYRTTRPTRVAVLPVGYYEGYDRGLSGELDCDERRRGRRRRTGRRHRSR